MDSTIDLSDVDRALDLSRIRYQLMSVYHSFHIHQKKTPISVTNDFYSRLEDSIIFYLIERVQFPHNPSIYTPGAITIPNFAGSFLDWMLQQQETIHAQVRRYQAPDEYPFFPSDLPANPPFLAPLTYPKLLHPNNVNINDKIKKAYVEHIIPACCSRSDKEDRGEAKENYGSAAVADVNCLQALSRRIHFGKFVAEAKFRQEPERFTKMIQEKDIKGLEDAITKKAVEEQVLKRLELKAKTYGRDPSAVEQGEGGDDLDKINVQAVVDMYRVSFMKTGMLRDCC